METKGFQLTPRDIEIVERVARHRFLQSTHLTTLFQGNPKVVERRIRNLCQTQYLERVAVRQAVRRHGGSEPLIYGLSRNGGRLLQEHASYSPTRLRFLQQHKDKRESVEHALMISDFIVALERSLVGDRREFISPAQLREQVFGDWKQFAWRVTIEHKRAPLPCSVIPDEAFAMRNPDSGQLEYYFLEVDRGTMPVRRRTMKLSSYYRKLSAYLGFREQWNVKPP